MLTTATPPGQELSMARRAAKPLKLPPDGVDALGRVAENLRGRGRFLGHRDVRGPGGHDYDSPAAGRRFRLLQADNPGGLVIDGAGELGFDLGPDRGLDPGDEEVRAFLEDLPGTGADLDRRLAQAEDDLGGALDDLAVVVDLGEFEGAVGVSLKEFEGLGRRELPAVDLLQDLLQALFHPYILP